MKPPYVVKRTSNPTRFARWDVVDRRDNSIIATFARKSNANATANLSNSIYANYGGLS
jgi:hypothetical protein